MSTARERTGKVPGNLPDWQAEQITDQGYNRSNATPPGRIQAIANPPQSPPAEIKQSTPLVISSAAPNNDDGMPDGTIYVRVP